MSKLQKAIKNLSKSVEKSENIGQSSSKSKFEEKSEGIEQLSPEKLEDIVGGWNAVCYPESTNVGCGKN